MRRRRVILTIEAETNLTLAELRNCKTVLFEDAKERCDCFSTNPADEKHGFAEGTILQVQVNVVKAEKKPEKTRR